MTKSDDRGLLTPKKREFLKLAAVTGGTGFITSHAVDASGTDIKPPYTTPFVEPLPIPPIKKAAAATLYPVPQKEAHPDEAGRDPHQGWEHWPPQKAYVIDVKEGWHYYHRELPRQKIWGYDGILPGPTMVAYEGEPIVVRYYNNLKPDVNGFGSPEISTHLHNAHAASESDGYAGNYFSATKYGPTLTRPGFFYDCHYPNCFAGYDEFPDTDGDPREGLGTMWYHDHRADFTAANVYKGLAGFFLFFDKLDTGNENDPSPTALRLPSGVGVYDIPLILQDPKFDSGGLRVFDQFDPDGFLGNKFAINGKIQPYFNVASRKYRFRILNGSTARFYHLSLRYKGVDKPFQVIANDGNLLPKSVTMTSFRLAPAERIDIIVDFKDFPLYSELFLLDRIVQDKGRGPEAVLSTTGQQLMRFYVNRTAVDNSRVPTVLRDLKPIDLTKVTKTRHFEFERENGVWLIDGKLFDVENPTFKVKLNAVEIWELEGKGSWHHPIHIHLEEGRILSRNGKPPPAHEMGRKDVFVLAPGETVKILIQFRGFTGKYMMHCHNTIHEDHAMMLRFDVERDG
ncbi:multicopper oxidase family protein [Massilia niastensis]|uniref:multicopper oxidase family protein n=1 Tax=Massilia niastensis TaxID=544911 RepID=UPI001B7FE80B|nr:multicopper oxidase domain-containing protein [Massilia niastensis]